MRHLFAAIGLTQHLVGPVQEPMDRRRALRRRRPLAWIVERARRGG
ncbi:hypothetical protein [Actinoplanes sp. NPDC051851]